jgi:tetraacyldisaccharide 4'-kinase
MQIVDYLNPYAYIMRLRRMMYERGWLKSYHPGIPVISVGNLKMGGTGKSPMVLLIAKYLESKHSKRVAIISRGYKRSTKGFLLVSNGKEILASVEDSGDEAQMLAELLPNTMVIVDEDRVRGAKKAKELGSEVIILDDGFQHLRLRPDINILLIAGTSSPVIPFGRSREPAIAARAADVIISSDGRDTSDLKNENSNIVFATVRVVPSSLMSFSVPDVPLTELKSKHILALSSIANPERFYVMLRELGATVVPKSLGDHAEYSESLVEKILTEAKTSGVEMIVTTMKDAVKSRQYFMRVSTNIPILILLHSLEFLRGKDGFYGAIDKIL